MDVMAHFVHNRQKYLVVIAGFLIFCGILSPANSYARLFTVIQKELNTTTIQSGWVGSTSWSTSFLGGPLAVPIEYYIGHRFTTVLGCVLASCCYLMTSFATNYAGVLIFFGLICGTALGISIHSIVCVIFKTFSSRNQSQATSMALLGASFGTIFLSLAYEKIIPAVGWRRALQITFGFSSISSIPVSFLITPREDSSKQPSRTSTNSSKAVGEDEGNGKEVIISSVSAKVDDEVTEQAQKNNHTVKRKRWLHLIFLWRAWAIFFALCFPAMSWSVYWVNSVSYFESISASADDIFVYLTIMTISDFVGKVSIIVIPSRYLEAVKTLTIVNCLAVIVTTLFVLCPIKSVLAACCVFIGVGRAWYNILPFKVAVEMLQVTNSDQGVTLGMIALGVGFGIGTLPAGAVYDITGSYTMAFIINAVFYFIGGAFLIVLQFCCKKKSRKDVKSNVQRSQYANSQGVDNINIEVMEDLANSNSSWAL